MLNTDLHNPAIKKEKKMTQEDFIKNNKKIDQGKDLPKKYLKKIYNNIKRDQIQMDAGVSVYHNAEKKGWLLKRGGRIKTWKRRWFVLNDNCLYYFKHPKDKQPLGIIPLENLGVRTSSGKVGKPNPFEIHQKDRTQEMKAMKITNSGSVAKGHHDIYLFSVNNTFIESKLNLLSYFFFPQIGWNPGRKGWLDPVYRRQYLQKSIFRVDQQKVVSEKEVFNEPNFVQTKQNSNRKCQDQLQNCLWFGINVLCCISWLGSTQKSSKFCSVWDRLP